MSIDREKISKILVTGGSGFLGSHLVESLLTDGYDVTNFDLIQNRVLPAKTRQVQGNITDLQETQQALTDYDGIVHLAAISREAWGNKNPYKCVEVNLLGTTNILEVVRNSKTRPWLIIGSSIDSLDESLFANNGVKQSEQVVSFYRTTKFISELLCKQYTNFYRLRTMVLKFGDIYGSIRDHRDKVLPLFVSNILKNKKIQINPSAKMFNFIFWKDIVDGIKRSISFIEDSKMGCYDEFVLSTNNQISLKSLAKLIESQVYGKPLENRPLDGTTHSLELESKLKKAKDRLGFSAVVVLEEGLRLYIEECKREISS